MHGAIHFDDEPRCGTGKIRDEAPDDQLPAEGNAALPAAELSPEPLLGERWMLAHAVRVSLELELTLTDETLLMA